MGQEIAKKASIRDAPSVDRLLVLPFRNSVRIAVQSIRVRFFRSLITTLSLVLAVSFLSYVRVDTDVANGMLATGQPRYLEALTASGYDVGPEIREIGSTPKQRWIVVLSLLVCVVGIVNAQLMAVTERFREIGTMKCLGALDRFILRLFLLEAGIQGLIGAAVGALAGAVFALANALVSFGLSATATVSAADVVSSIGFAVGAGIVLSLIGVLYPAVVAARMQPVEAMRTEH